MEEVLLRFPHLGGRIFKILSNNGLIQCKMVTKTWYHFITNEKFYKQRVHYENLQKDVDAFGNTPLHNAAKDGDSKNCKLIIDHVENKNPANDNGWTPLHYAAENGHLDIYRVIIENVEDKNPDDINGWTKDVY